MTVNQLRAERTGVSRRTVLKIIFLFISSFLLGRISIAQEMHPFGVAFMIASFRYERSAFPYVCSLGVFASLCSLLSYMPHADYNFSLVTILCVAFTVLLISKIRLNLPALLGITAAAYIIPCAIFKSTMMLSYAYSLGEAALSFTSSLVFLSAIKIIDSPKKRHLFDEAEIICLTCLAALCTAGIGDFSFLGIYPVCIITGTAVIIGTYISGAAKGSLIAAICALTSVIAGISYEFPCAIILCAAVSGLFCSASKPVYASVFLSSSAIICAIIGAGFLHLTELIPGAILLFIIPRHTLEEASSFLNESSYRKKSLSLLQSRFNKVTSGELTSIAKVLKNSAHLLNTSANIRKKSGIRYVIADIPERCCEKCEKYPLCWDKHFNETYSFMKEMFNRFSLTGKITEKDLSREYETHCLKPKRLVSALNCVFKEYSLGSRWESKVMESRIAISDELRGVSSALTDLDKRIHKELVMDDETEAELAVRLDRIGYCVKDICVISRDDERFVDIKLKSCGGGTNCKKHIPEAVSNAMGCKMSLSALPICSDDYCVLSLERSNAITLKTAVSRATKKGSPVSGDTYSLKPLPDGRYMLLICDGMGSGERAQRESFAAANLIEDYYNCGFDGKSILGMINKLMLISSSDEVFSAIDLCIVDLKEAQAKFTKIGAPHSYIISKDNVRRLSAGALPLGILEDCEPQEHETSLEAGDLIILFSDGIAEAELNDNALYSKITQINPCDSVKSIADGILSQAIASCGGAPADDLTVIVSRVLSA